MHSCKQFKGQSVLEHGLSVKNHTFDLINHLKFNKELKYTWKLPNWVYENRAFILDNLTNLSNIKMYTVLHDCGKPYCHTIDEEGKSHFKNHAEISYTIFKKLFDNEDVADMIRDDMKIHTLKSEDLCQFCESKHAVTSLIVGLAEVHSNAKMFGGLDSINFKIKYKHIEKRGKQIIQHLKTKITIK